ncbi:MAG: sigma-70 family RNA polymerase sigma factor [Clostridia bacterium]|nr:sigma-70 family RNA polymerase sigma factor [Clostridia bacterium]
MDFSVSEQLAKARAGSENALAVIIAKQMPSIRAQAARMVRPGLDFDDAVQEGLIALFHAVQTFDEAKGAGFDTYANVCVQNALVSAAKSAARLKHSPLNNFVPLDEVQSDECPEDIVLQSESYSKAMEGIETLLSPFEKQVLLLFIDGLSYADIAKKLASTEKSVDNALQRVRAKLK